MRMVSVWFAVLLVVAGLFSLGAQAAVTPAIQTSNLPRKEAFIGFAGASWKGTIGWSFTVGANPITVSQLGLYDSGGNGLAESHQIGLWTGDGSLLLRSTTVPAGTSATLSGAYRYVPVTPVTLNAGQTYVIGAFYSVNSGDDILLVQLSKLCPATEFHPVATESTWIRHNVRIPQPRRRTFTRYIRAEFHAGLLRHHRGYHCRG